MKIYWLLFFTSALLINACADISPIKEQPSLSCDVEFVILGIGQDGGAPQIGNPDDPAWTNSSLKLWAASGALIDHRHSSRYLFEATPDLREQMNMLDSISSGGSAPLGLSGVFLTHAHIGHYAGLIFVGHESIGTQGLKVFSLPRMQNYLENNGPWDQLVNYKNIDLMPITAKKSIVFNDDLSVTAHLVPHRDEYSETAGYVVSGPSKSVLFLPDIDDWDRWETEFKTRIEDMISQVDVAYLDATFFDNNELPGRDMSKIPHPRVVDSMGRFENLPRTEQEKVRFFHINHSNQIRYSSSEQYNLVQQKGFKIAKRGERVCLD
ncbi:MAG: pyrroloquinoline quinone biosynthesis protein B [Congregibacter sp.]|jgi:pyrroloquinoline quinone biosynthesis protein B